MPIDTEEWALRVDLAAAFRLAERHGWHESVANHFSASLSDDGRRFLLNPKWKHFSTIRASDLVTVNLDQQDNEQLSDLDESALTIHGHIHAALPRARVLLHCHPDYATALSALKDPTIKPIDQNTCRFYKRVAYDLSFGGLGDTAAEGTRLAQAMGDQPIMMMGNHGVLVSSDSVAHAFELLYYLEKASRTMILAYSTGQPLNEIPTDIARKTAAGWDNYRGISAAHFAHLKARLDLEDSTYSQ